jgi:hypothetical protein
VARSAVPTPLDDRRTVSPLPSPLTLTTWSFASVAAVLLALALFVAIVLPYGAFDALWLGTWSRLMAAHWPTFHFAAATAGDYQRPLFFVLQGFVWRLFGFHQALGRLLSLAFALVLLAGVAWLAGRTAQPYRRLAAALAVVLLLMVPSFETYIAAGLTDIPVAAMIAVTAALLVARRLGRAQLPLVTLAAALSVLTKPSALPSLAGLGAAVLLGARSDLRRRAFACLALALGSILALLYELSQARYVHVGLLSFLEDGTTGSFYSGIANQDRHHVLFDGAWLGPDLRVLLWFAFAYAIVRLVVPSHRRAVAVAFPVAVVWSWLGPHIAGEHGLQVGILGTGAGTERIAVLVLAASILFAFDAPAAVVPDRLRLARLLVWALPTLVVWGADAVYDDRLLAPAWPPLILLLTCTFLPALAGALRRINWLIAVPAAAIVALGILAAYNINGLGSSGWRQLRAGGVSALTNPAAMRDIALGGDFAAELNALAPQVGKNDSILTYDNRLSFYYVTQTDIQVPLSCSQTRGHRIFVLLEDDEIVKVWGKRGTSAFWEACKNPTLTKVAERPGAFAIFTAGAPTPAAGECGAPAPQDQGMAIEFGRMRTAAQAQSLLKRVKKVGFVEAKVEQLGCLLYRVVETGVPSKAVGQSIIAEAKSAGFTATLVPQ